jgi:hypothetical protein
MVLAEGEFHAEELFGSPAFTAIQVIWEYHNLILYIPWAAAGSHNGPSRRPWVKSHNVDRDHLTVESETLQSFGGDNVVGIIERWDYEDLIPDAIIHVNTIITNTYTLSSSNR